MSVLLIMSQESFFFPPRNFEDAIWGRKEREGRREEGGGRGRREKSRQMKRTERRRKNRK